MLNEGVFAAKNSLITKITNKLKSKKMNKKYYNSHVPFFILL